MKLNPLFRQCFKYLALEIVKATVTLFSRLLHNEVSTHRLLRRLRHLAPESKFVFNEMDVEDILFEKSIYIFGAGATS